MTMQSKQIYIDKNTKFQVVDIVDKDGYCTTEGVVVAIFEGKKYIVAPQARTKSMRGHGNVSNSYGAFFEFGEDAVKKEPSKFVKVEKTIGWKYADHHFVCYFKIGAHDARPVDLD